MIHGRTIFWFKRDLRTDDNTGLINAVRDSGEVIPLYVLEDSILSKYTGESKRLGFFSDALSNLETELKKLGSYLLVLRGKAEEIIPALIQSQKADAV